MKLLVGFAIPDKEQLCSNSKVYIDWDKLLDIDTKTFDTFMLTHGFKRSHADHYLYTKWDVACSPIILVLYVDNISYWALKRKIHM